MQHMSNIDDMQKWHGLDFRDKRLLRTAFVQLRRLHGRLFLSR
jgi:hypothetical protein